jgi:hypothetical protein
MEQYSQSNFVSCQHAKDDSGVQVNIAGVALKR